MKTKTKSYIKEKVLIVLFAALLILPFPLFMIFKNVVDTENFENRILATFPSVSQVGVRGFPPLFDAYLNDHAPFRNQFMKLYGGINLKLFSMVDHDNVILGEDGWLFYNEYTENNEPIGVSEYFSIMDYQGMVHLGKEQLETCAQELSKLEESLAQSGKRLVLFVAPNKESIYSEFVPAAYPKLTQETMADQMVDYLQQSTSANVVFPKKELLAHKEQAQVYYKYDTHWNETGAFIGVQEINKALGLPYYTLAEIAVNTQQGKTVNDLAMMTATYPFYNMDTLAQVNYLEQVEVTQTQMADDVILYTSTSENKQKVLLIRDSFGTSMYASLPKHFAQVTSVHGNAITPELLNQTEADVVIIETVERYIYTLPATLQKYNAWLAQNAG